MDITAGLAVIALLVSVLSAVYARWAAVAARNANGIAVHSQKLEILHAVRAFRAMFQLDGEALERAHYQRLFIAAGTGSLYFTPPVADHLSRYADAANRVLNAHDGIQRYERVGREPPKGEWDEVFRLVDKCRAEEGSLLTDLESQTKALA